MSCPSIILHIWVVPVGCPTNTKLWLIKETTSHQQPLAIGPHSMNKENQPLVTIEPDRIWKRIGWRSRLHGNHWSFRGTYGLLPPITFKCHQISQHVTCWTWKHLGYWLNMPKNRHEHKLHLESKITNTICDQFLLTARLWPTSKTTPISFPTRQNQQIHNLKLD